MNSFEYNFNKSVFINCPFDNDYQPMLRVLIFTVIECGFDPRIAIERSDSGEPRIKKIVSILGSSKFSIHDISRSESHVDGSLPRFNMPFELGIDMGCREYGSTEHKSKCCLIVESKKYHYHKVISDISGSDIEIHNNEPIELIKTIRDWFATNGAPKVPLKKRIWDLYNEFLFYLAQRAQELGSNNGDISEFTITEYIYHAHTYRADRLSKNSQD